MDPSSAHFKKEQLKARLNVKETAKQLAVWWLPVLEVLHEANTIWSLEYFVCAEDFQYGFWLDEIGLEPWNQFPVPKMVIKKTNDFYVHDSIVATFPNTHPLRYVPDLPKFNKGADETGQSVLKRIIHEVSLDDAEVYFVYLRFAPVLKLQLKDIVQLADTELFLPMEDVGIVAKDYSWMLFRTLEDEWYFGTSNI